MTSPDGQYQNQIDYILCNQRWRSSIQSAKTRVGVDHGSDHEPLIAKFRLQLKKVEKPLDHSGKTKSNPLRLYSGSEKQIQRIRSDRVPKELCTEVCDNVQQAVIKTSPKK